MRRLPLILISLLAFTSMVAADTLYKWVDDQGNVHYSDKPQPGAQKIEIPKAPTFTPATPAMPVPPPATGASRPQDSGHLPYTQISVSSPKDQDTVWNTSSVTVSVSLTPALQAGDSVTISVDGQSQTTQGTATFTDLDRGEHDVTVTVNGRSASGTLRAQSVFYIQRGTQKNRKKHTR